ncbi:hypothetical protein OAE56_00660 [Verrucomicrobiales bacterium]|nr:hypothetical protein [Verrucomicrobiales bacterium]
MAVACEFIDIIIPIAKIDEAYPGGFQAFKQENTSLFGGRLWHDDFILRDGAMNPHDVKSAVEFWEHYGLVGQQNVGEEAHWKDICVIEAMIGGATLPCSWIEFDPERRCVFHKGDSSPTVIDRSHFQTPDGCSDLKTER